MSAVAPTSVPVLEVRRRVSAPRQKVFQYWTDPEQVRRWLGGPKMEVPFATIDLREGGGYEYRLVSPEGIRSKILGTFLTVLEPKRLVYTWSVENDAGRSPETQVTVEFHDQDGDTEVIIEHQRFLDSGVRRAHQQGWFDCLDAFEEMFA